MGLLSKITDPVKNFARGQIIKQVLKQVPMFTTAFKWLTDPSASGRKRTLVAVLVALVGIVKVLGVAFATACGADTLHGFLCTVDPETVTGFIDLFVQWINSFDSSTDIITALLAGWALYDAKKKADGMVGLSKTTPKDDAATELK